MINNINFTGRETMLTSGLKKGVQKTVNVIKASSILPKSNPIVAQPNVVKINYASPYAPIAAPAEQIANIGRNGLNFFA